MMLGEIEDSRKSFKKILERKRIPWQARRYRRCRFYAFVERIVGGTTIFCFYFLSFSKKRHSPEKIKRGKQEKNPRRIVGWAEKMKKSSSATPRTAANEP